MLSSGNRGAKVLFAIGPWPRILLSLACFLYVACSAPSESRRQLPTLPLAGAPAVDAGVVSAIPVCDATNPFCEQPPIAPTMTGTPGLVPIQTDCGAVP